MSSFSLFRRSKPDRPAEKPREADEPMLEPAGQLSAYFSARDRAAHPLEDGSVLVYKDVTESRRAARALAQSEERTRQILATAHDAFIAVDKDGCIVDWNAAAEEIFGWPRAEVIARPFAETLILPPTADHHVPGLGSSDERGTIERRIELIARHRSGRAFPAELTISPLQLDDAYVFNIFVRDISDRVEARLQLQQERDFLDAVLESLTDGVVACAPDGQLTIFNRATREIHGMSEEPLPPEHWPDRYDVFKPDGHTRMDPEDVPLARALRGERVQDVEVVVAPKGLPPRRLLCNGQPIEGGDGRRLGAVVAMHDVTERTKAEEELVHQALHDSLTGLPNRVLLLDRLRHALAVARRDDSAVAVLFADLDHFKLVNDSLGHDVGDELLTVVATRLEEELRGADTVGRPSADTVARLGGDEFVVLCEGLTTEHDAIRVAERVADALEAPFVVRGVQVSGKASIGIAVSRGAGTPESLLRDADAAMYRAKERGRARYELFDAAMRARVVDRLQRENDLRRAIEQDELRLNFQPIVSLPDHRIVAAEALVRWEHPGRGTVGPGDFIALAEDSGLIVPLGRWVLRRACEQIAAWQDALGEELALQVSVNLSARQLADPRIVEELEQVLRDTGVRGDRLALEITETVLMEEGDAPVETLKALKRIGGRLVLDDFGIGYSSLSYLGRMPFDALKLDQSFVAPLTPNGKGRDIAAAMAQMAHALDMRIVAEGVENEQQLAALEELGFDRAQGYLFSHPLSAQQMTDLMTVVLAEAARRRRSSG